MEQGQPMPEQEVSEGPEQMFQQTGEALAKIAEMAGQSGAPPEIAQSFAQIAEQFAQTVEAMMSAAQGGGAQGSQPVSPEQGAGNAVPMR